MKNNQVLSLMTESSLRSPSVVVSHEFLLSFGLFVLGSLFQMWSYQTPAPFIVGAVFWFSGSILLLLTRSNGRHEKASFTLVFGSCWFWAGIAAIYGCFLGDPMQTQSDAATFFNLASGEASGLALADLKMATGADGAVVTGVGALVSGAGAVVIWRAVYDFFAILGFEKLRYIGIGVNVFLVAMTSVIGVKVVKELYGDDATRFQRFTRSFACCGIFLLFAAIHLRDAAILFFVTLLTLAWVKYTNRRDTISLLILGLFTVGGFVGFAFLRKEFLFVPLAMMMAGIAAISLSSSTRISRKILLLTFFSIVFLYSYNLSQEKFKLLDLLMQGNESYSELSGSQHEGESLGMKVIVNAPLPVRIILGSIYCFIFPIPVWSGFQLVSSYNLFKSIHAISMYFLLPLFLLALWRIAQNRVLRTASNLFLISVVIGFTLAIAATSLETRHLGPFLVPFLVLSVLPDLNDKSEMRTYKTALSVLVVGMASIHIAWLFLKGFQ